MNSNFTVFLVDDSPEITELIKEQLDIYDSQLNIVAFNNPAKALAYLKNGNRPEIIITDYNMGVVNGTQILKASPVESLKILITANINSSTRKEVLELGTTIFEKPLSMRKIVNEIREYSERLVIAK